MTTTPLSSANSGYLNSILNNTYKAPQPQIAQETKEQPKKESNGAFSKALLCLAAAGTLGIQAFGLSKKPASVDLSQEVKAINELVNGLKDEVAKLGAKVNDGNSNPVDMSKIDDISKAIATLQQGMNKVGKENPDTKASLGILKEMQAQIAKLQQTPKEEKIDNIGQISELIAKFAKEMTALVEQAVQKNTTLEEQISKSQKELQKVAQKAKEEIEQTASKANQTLSQDTKKVQGQIAQMSKQIEGVSVKVENASAQTQKIDSLEKLCKEITQLQSQQDKVTQSRFEELIDAFNMFIGVKKLPVEMVEFKGEGNAKIPFIKGTNEIFTGILTKELKDGSFYEISYVDGKLVQSKKFDSTGKKLLQKRYNKILTKLDSGAFKHESSVTITDGTPIATKTVFDHTRNAQGENLVSKICKKVINEDDKTARDTFFLFKNDKMMRTFELDGDKKIEKIYTSTSGKTPYRTTEDSFKIVELEADVKDPYKYFTFRPNK